MIQLIALLFPVLALAAPPKTLLSVAPPITASVGQKLQFHPLKGHHFNLDAPLRCGDGKIASKAATLVECEMTVAGKQTLTLAICDDANTFCNIEKHPIEVSGSSGKSPAKAAPAAPKPTKAVPHGFLLNAPQEAIARAKAGGKLILVDFATAWCPPCNLFDELVFPNAKFKQAVKRDYIALEMDGDEFSSTYWKERFKIKGYPTLLVLNSDLQEIGRLVGYRPLANTVKFLQEQAQNKAAPIETSKDARRIALWKWEREEWAEAATLLKDLNKHARDPLLEKRQLWAEYKLAAEKAETSKDQAPVITTLIALLDRFPDAVDVGYWTLKLHALAPEEAKKRAPAMLQTLEGWFSKPAQLAEEDYLTGDLAEYQAEIYTFLEQPEAAKKAYARCAQEYGALAMKSPLRLAKGANLVRANCLLSAGDAAGARALYEKMASTYRHEPTFHYNYARALRELKDYAAALPYAENAAKYGYGGNRLGAVVLQSELLKELGKKDEARAVATAELAKVRAEEPTPTGRTKRSVERLEKLLKEI